jgi:hypothetical protein
MHVNVCVAWEGMDEKLQGEGRKSKVAALQSKPQHPHDRLHNHATK